MLSSVEEKKGFQLIWFIEKEKHLMKGYRLLYFYLGRFLLKGDWNQMEIKGLFSNQRDILQLLALRT